MPVEQQDLAVVELAKIQAKKIDGGDTRGVNPMLDILVELRMTPKARNAVVGGSQQFDGDSDKITNLRSRRLNRAANLD